MVLIKDSGCSEGDTRTKLRFSLIPTKVCFARAEKPNYWIWLKYYYADEIFSTEWETTDLGWPDRGHDVLVQKWRTRNRRKIQ